MSKEELLRINDLKVHYFTLRGIVKAVDGVSLTLNRNEFLSIVGESGCGKSTLAHAIAKLIRPPGRIIAGNIFFEGKDLNKLNEEEMRKIRGNRIGFVFQDPFTSLDPLQRVGDQISEVLIEHLNIEKKEAKEKAIELIKEVGLTEDRYNYYPHQLSGGQRQRVAIAIAIALNPSLLIADEPTTALDVIVQSNIMDLLQSLLKKGMSLIFITHDIALAGERSDNMAIMYAGKIAEIGKTSDIINEPLHPYTQGLISATPDIWNKREVKSIPGNPPDLINPPKGCRFHDRCKFAMDICKEKEPPLLSIKKRGVACWLYDEQKNG